MQSRDVVMVMALTVASPVLGQGLSGGPRLSTYGQRLTGHTTVPVKLTKPVQRRHPPKPLKTTPPQQGARGVRGALLGEDAGQAVASPWRAKLVTPKGNDIRQETLRSTHTKLAQAAVGMGRQAAQLSAADVQALIDASKVWRNRYSAGPEMRDALRAIARVHPDRDLRADAADAADALEQDAYLAELRREAHALRAAGKPGVEIWTAIARHAVDHNEDRADLTDAQKFDAVIADVAAVFNGPIARKHLQTYDATFGLLPGSDPNVGTMIDALGARDVRMAAAGDGIDPTHSTDFRPGFNDGTNNQVFHSNFFVLLGYSAAKYDGRVVNAVNLKHETVDHLVHGSGGSLPDWRASATGLRIGDTIRRLRDGDAPNVDPRRALEAIPSLIGAAFSNHPQDFARPWGAAGPDYAQLVKVVDADVRANMNDPYGEGNFANGFQRGMIRFVTWLR